MKSTFNVESVSKLQNIIMRIFIKNLDVKCARALYGECNDHACD